MPSPSTRFRLPRLIHTAHAPIMRSTLARQLRTLKLLALLLAFLVALSGCTPIVVGGAVVGASTIYDRRHYQIVIDDQQIEFSALHALSQDEEVQGQSRISATSYNRTVLLTGQAQSDAIAQRASELVSQVSKVERVVDEIGIGPALSIGKRSEDAYITSRAKFVLTKISLPDFNPLRVKVVTENAVVYLMGLVSQEEADAAAEQIRHVPGVTQVVKLFERNVPAV